MSGLPRSGSTVLSALLNQHPDIYASPQTDLIEILYRLENQMANSESYKAELLKNGYDNILRKIAHNLYEHIEKPVIIDKNKSWGIPHNLDVLMPYVSENGKLIVTLRPILEVLASFAKVFKKSEDAIGIAPYLNDNLLVTHYRSKEDSQIESLMQTNGEMDRAILSLANLLKNHGDRVFVVWFDNLIEAPQETLNGIYDFLDLGKHENDFNNISQVDVHNDIEGYGIFGLHHLSHRLQKPDTKPEDYLSSYIIDKYKNSLDFLWN
jgi:sulfotransferase